MGRIWTMLQPIIYLYEIQVCVFVSVYFLCVFLCVRMLRFSSLTDVPIALKFGMQTNLDMADVMAKPDFLISIFVVHNSHLKGYFLPFFNISRYLLLRFF